MKEMIETKSMELHVPLEMPTNNLAMQELIALRKSEIVLFTLADA